MKHIWTTLALCLIYFSGKALVDSNESVCYSFDNSGENWNTEYGYSWQWSGTQFPDAANIPAFEPTSQYLWFQNQATPPASGAFRSPTSYTLYYGDTVQSKIFRHMLQDDSINPVLRFVTTTGNVQDVLYTTEQDYWSVISIICTDVADWETNQAQCCQTYPCTGYFRLDGEVLVVDELLAIDDIGINGACGGTPPPPPPPTTTPPTIPTAPTTQTTTSITTPTTTTQPAPPSWCCDFTSMNACDWSPALIRDGWLRSLEVPDPDIEAITTDEYIYVVDTSAAATSPDLPLVPNSATFHIAYYYSSEDDVSVSNQLTASFTSSNGIFTDLAGPLAQTDNDFAQKTLSHDNLCGGLATCSGTFSLTTYNTPGIHQTAALKKFSIGNVPC